MRLWRFSLWPRVQRCARLGCGEYPAVVYVMAEAQPAKPTKHQGLCGRCAAYVLSKEAISIEYDAQAWKIKEL